MRKIQNWLIRETMRQIAKNEMVLTQFTIPASMIRDKITVFQIWSNSTMYMKQLQTSLIPKMNFLAEQNDDTKFMKEKSLKRNPKLHAHLLEEYQPLLS